jgi:hypothetical protein
MFNPGLAMFDDAVTKSFASIATRTNSVVKRLAPDAFEISSEKFVLRIRYGTGHRKDVLVTLSPSNQRVMDVHNLRGEIGLGAIAKILGEYLTEPSFDDEKEYYQYVEYIAKVSERLLAPYLLGLKDDFEQIEKSIRGRGTPGRT